MTTWVIWKSRCSSAFQNIYLNPARIAYSIDFSVFRLCASLSSSQTTVPITLQASFWIPPCQNVCKINVDVSFRNQTSPIGIGCIIRNSDGKFLYAGTVSGHASSVEEAESEGVLFAIQKGVELHLKAVVIETDNKGVADYLQNQPSNLSWSTHAILDQAVSIASFFDVIMYSFYSRACNTSAHMLAAAADLNSTATFSFFAPPRS
ncbi:hypothetical protein FRX31_003932 [Thalictrum thalictroides]|uniref:RNase H type-1 domain-containing protein n=1 Tax=Thalictrum thalictroides TaxID=46969 RepID=A0A7J6X9S4_THATH|nr:hypothetical protein FRX31_003932 [Thalictrum thalictroides]